MLSAVREHGIGPLGPKARTSSFAMLGLPERHLQNGHWVYAGQLLMAAATDKGVSLHDVQQQLLIALKAEGLI
jgi:hypothetical protein